MTMEKVHGSEENECFVCLGIMQSSAWKSKVIDLFIENNDAEYIIPCGSIVKHKVHWGCAKDWIIARNKTDCPYCRGPLPQIDKVRKQLRGIWFSLHLWYIKILQSYILFLIVKLLNWINIFIIPMKLLMIFLYKFLLLMINILMKFVLRLFGEKNGEKMKKNLWRNHVETPIHNVQQWLLINTPEESKILYRYVATQEIYALKFDKNQNIPIIIAEKEILESTSKIRRKKNPPKNIIAYSPANSCYVSIQKRSFSCMKEEKSKTMIVSCIAPMSIWNQFEEEVMQPHWTYCSPLMKIMLVAPFTPFLDISGIIIPYIILMMIIHSASRPRAFTGLYILRNHSRWIRKVSLTTFQTFYDDN